MGQVHPGYPVRTFIKGDLAMRKTGIALSAFALALTLGACGDNGGSNGSANTGADNNNGGSVVAANLADLAKSIGDETADTNTAHMTITADAAGQQLTGEGDLKMGAEDAAMSMDMTTPEGTISMVLLDKVFYIKLPQELSPGKAWLKIDANDDNPIAKALGGMTEQMSKNADPRAALEEFEKSGEITSSKEEDLDGQKTTHYTITVDVEKLAANQTDATAKKALEDSIKAGMKDFDVDLWVNEDDLPVRFKMDMPTPDPTGSGTTTTVKMQMDYTEWGEPVEITAPPAEQIAEFPTA
jgi:hypothetical protein